MICVRVELMSAVTHRTSEIGRMYLANVGGSAERGDYDVAVCRRDTEAVPSPIDPSGPAPTRSGRVSDYPRLAHNVWRLITRACLTAFPEEDKPRKKSDRALLSPEVMRGLTLISRHLRDAGHDWSRGTDMSDVRAAQTWLDAANREDS